MHDGIVNSLATARDRGTVNTSWVWAAGSIVSTAPDLSRFFGAVLQGRLLSPRLLQLMRPTPGSRYGFGLAAFRTPCGSAIGHTGALLGTVSAAWSSADGRRRVVAMSNSFPISPSAEAAFRRLLDSSFCGGYKPTPGIEPGTLHSSGAASTPPCNAAQDRARRLWLVGRLIWIIFIVLVVVTVIYVATATLQSG